MHDEPEVCHRWNNTPPKTQRLLNMAITSMFGPKVFKDHFLERKILLQWIFAKILGNSFVVEFFA